jgi:hypothetical protein
VINDGPGAAPFTGLAWARSACGEFLMDDILGLLNSSLPDA